MATQQSVDQAIADPTKRFKCPMDVVNDPQLNAAQKRAILESWKKDAELMSTASDENMAGGEAPGLQDVSLALGKLEPVSGAAQ